MTAAAVVLRGRVDRRQAALVGVVVGLTLAAWFMPGGYDAFHYFLRYPDHPAIAMWAFFTTYPLSLLGWPLSWMALNALTLAAGLFAARVAGARWWTILLSAPMAGALWLGQVDGFVLAGAAVALFVMRGRLGWAWLGAAWAMLLIKPQTGIGVVAITVIAAWQARKLRLPTAVLIAIAAASLIFAPDWILRWPSEAYQQGIVVARNGSAFPYTAMAWTLIAWPARTIEQRFKMALCAALLGSPYLTLNHTLALTMVGGWAAWAAGWIVVAASAITPAWHKFVWIIPAACVAAEMLPGLLSGNPLIGLAVGRAPNRTGESP